MLPPPVIYPSSGISGRGVAAIILSMLAVVGGMIALAVSHSPTYGPRGIPVFDNGEMVEMVAFGTKGMVVSANCWRAYNGTPGGCKYSVRFSAIQMNTNVSLFGSDGPVDVAPVAVVHGIKEFELRRVR